MDKSYYSSPACFKEERSSELFNLTVAFMIIETIFIILYFSSRALSKTFKGWDIWLMLSAYFINVGLLTCILLQLERTRLGAHLCRGMNNMGVLYWKLQKAVTFLYATAISAPKLAVLCLYYRIFKTKAYYYAIVTTAILVVIHWLVMVLAATLICRPFGQPWKQIEKYPQRVGSCGNLEATYSAVSIANILTDIAILVLPMHAIWHLHAQSAKKIGLTITFLTGCLGLITAIVRAVEFVLISRQQGDSTYSDVRLYTWTLIEPGVYLIAATLPFMRPLLRSVLPTFDVRSLRKRPHGLRLIGPGRQDSTIYSHNLIENVPPTKSQIGGNRNDHHSGSSAYTVDLSSPPKIYAHDSHSKYIWETHGTQRAFGTLPAVVAMSDIDRETRLALRTDESARW